MPTPSSLPSLALSASVLLVALAGTASAQAVQLSASASASCSSVSPVADASGTVVAWQSDCDPTGGNADGSLEIFRRVAGGAVEQLTSGTGCSSGRPSISDNGNRVAFESSCNLTGSNADGNVEIFVWRNSGGALQRTFSVGCDNLAPSINGGGSQVAFDSTCNTSGTNNNGRGSEIFRVSAVSDPPTLLQLTVDAVGDCDSTSASIDDSGNVVAFDSDCDLVGANEDRAIEIFTVTAGGAVTQRTFAPDDSCSSVRPSIDGKASVIGFHSDCDFAGANADRSDEVFAVVSGQEPRQYTDAGPGADCASVEVKVASSGLAMVFSSWCATAAANGDGSVEVFQIGVGAARGGGLAVTAGAGCSSLAGATDATGYRVFFDSDCDPAGANGDGGVEVFAANACVCGAPVTRLEPPKASDALFALRAAVSASVCAACECDVTDDGNITASDAERILRVAVGQVGFQLDCPLP